MWQLSSQIVDGVITATSKADAKSQRAENTQVIDTAKWHSDATTSSAIFRTALSKALLKMVQTSKKNTASGNRSCLTQLKICWEKPEEITENDASQYPN